MTDDPSDHDRADAAFRSALRSEQVDEVTVEPGGVRGRLRRRRARLAVVAAAVVVVLALAAVPFLRQFSTDSTAGDPTWRMPPAGWRIEQYRDVSIFVPDSWGYASAPYADWCHVNPDGQPLPEQQKPYVSLGVPNALTPIDGELNCLPQPASLLTEHVEIKDAGLMMESPAPFVEQQGDWWVAIRIFDAQQITVKVLSRDRNLAQRIADSAALGGPCPATSPVQERQRIESSVNLAAFAVPDRAVICQYKPGRIAPPSQFIGAGGPFRLTGLEGASIVSNRASRELVRSLVAASALNPVRPPCSSDSEETTVAIAIQLYVGQREGTIYLTAGTCVDRGVGNKYIPVGAETGGIDLGNAVYPWTTPVCDAVIQPPVVVDRSTTWACSR